MNCKKYLSGFLPLVVLLAACGGDGTEPTSGRPRVLVYSGDDQFGARSGTLAEPLQVLVIDPQTNRARDNVTVQWRVVQGNGAALTPPASNTNSEGIASTVLRLGSSAGEYRVEATVANQSGDPARFTARAVDAPTIATIAPTTAAVGDTVTISGSNFSPTAAENTVSFGGFRGQVTSATSTQLRVIVPACVPTRTVNVRVLLGAVTGTSGSLAVQGAVVNPLQLAVGQATRLSSAAELSCFALPNATPSYTALLIPQNIEDTLSAPMLFELAALTGSPTTITSVATFISRGTNTVATDWEGRLRKRERAFLHASDGALLRPQSSQQAACPTPATVGDTCRFQVLDRNDRFVTVTAELRAVSTRALIYQDVEAPANGLTNADFQFLTQVFDDPIYATTVNAFGSPSDIDANSRIIILLTPIVNELTPRGSNGFIAGFFYGCDLVSASVCSGTNRAEIFYALTADPNGEFGDVRTAQTIRNALPPVLAHEFQHMIHFAQRNSAEVLWLSEGLAHHAEDLVGDVFEARGDATSAARFKAQNYSRATFYLRDPPSTSLISHVSPGTLEQRGAAWLFVKYLVGQHGTVILQRLTQTQSSSVQNVEEKTSKSWATLMSDWAIALYADDAPGLTTATALRPEHTYPNINLRSALSTGGSYPLAPSAYSFQDLSIRSSLPASSQEYIQVQAPITNPPTLRLTLAGAYGGVFAAMAKPQISVLRIQ